MHIKYNNIAQLLHAKASTIKLLWNDHKELLSSQSSLYHSSFAMELKLNTINRGNNELNAMSSSSYSAYYNGVSIFTHRQQFKPEKNTTKWMEREVDIYLWNISKHNLGMNN